MNRFLKYWRITGRGKAFRAQVVHYADAFVILSCRQAAAARDWRRKVMRCLKLTLNEAKTKLRDGRRESFDFLGDTFGPQRYRKDGHGYWGASPSKKRVARLRRKVNEVLVAGNQGTWLGVRERLNRLLGGWSSYFSHGTRRSAYGAVDNHVAARVRHFLRRRHQLPSRGTRLLADEVIFGPLGVLRLRRVH
jgi:RNA-directed DNA polymerase